MSKDVYSEALTDPDKHPLCMWCGEAPMKYTNGLCQSCARTLRDTGELPTDEMLCKRYGWDELYRLILQDKEGKEHE